MWHSNERKDGRDSGGGYDRTNNANMPAAHSALASPLDFYPYGQVNCDKGCVKFNYVLALITRTRREEEEGGAMLAQKTVERLIRKRRVFYGFFNNSAPAAV